MTDEERQASIGSMGGTGLSYAPTQPKAWPMWTVWVGIGLFTASALSCGIAGGIYMLVDESQSSSLIIATVLLGTVSTISVVLASAATPASKLSAVCRWSAPFLVAASFAPSAVLVANGKPDTGSASTFEGGMSRKVVRMGKSPSYYMCVDVPQGNKTVEHRVSVNRQKYDAARVGDPMRLVIKPGALGMPWVVEHSAGRQDEH